MLTLITVDAGHGIFNSDTVGLIFTYFVVIPAIVTGLVVVSVISGRGEKAADAELRARWTRRPADDE